MVIHVFRQKQQQVYMTPCKGKLYVNFFKTDSEDNVNAPLTNLGCEGNFSAFGNDCKKAGGSAKLETLSDKNVIAKNEFYSKERWCEKSETERRESFKWARANDQAKEVKRMEAELEKEKEKNL